MTSTDLVWCLVWLTLTSVVGSELRVTPQLAIQHATTTLTASPLKRRSRGFAAAQPMFFFIMFTASSKKMGCNPAIYVELFRRTVENAIPVCGNESPKCTKECKEYFEVIIRYLWIFMCTLPFKCLKKQLQGGTKKSLHLFNCMYDNQLRSHWCHLWSIL